MLKSLLLLINKSKNTLVNNTKENVKWFYLLDLNEKKNWLLPIWTKYGVRIVTVLLWVILYFIYVIFLIYNPEETKPEFICLYREEILFFHNTLVSIIPSFLNILESIFSICINIIYKALNIFINVDYWWKLYLYYSYKISLFIYNTLVFIYDFLFNNRIFSAWIYYNYQGILWMISEYIRMDEALTRNRFFRIWLYYNYIIILNIIENPVVDFLSIKNFELANIYDAFLVKVIQTLITLNNILMWVDFYTIVYVSQILSVSVINIILIILFILIGGVIPLLERKYLSLIQRRVGPKFVGYNGRLQFIADAMKLLLKELIYLQNTNKSIITLLPIFILSINIFLILNVVFLNNIQIIDNNYFLFVMILIETITVIFLTYIGFLVKNKYTTIASVRLLNGIIVFEIFTTAVYLYFYLFYNKLSLQSVFSSNPIINKITVFLLNLPIFINFVLILLKRVPYDIIEAETELIMGYSTEHSGFLSGALLLIEYLHIFFWSYFIVIFII